ncbi:hypothetical protein Sango_2468400 [Sesamum angolense]|uniref:Reverse transcriptase/retrotransposon-derived protein RNase H-like domain-containing protein n=1 Tax=Sesamum angolense TaxID=2727404 RepID=A0AAE1W3G1_9LAMI|nr:hypothetical protein Sango_2468400 [Sesamum angolense]
MIPNDLPPKLPPGNGSRIKLVPGMKLPARKKTNGSLPMYCDYRVLNKITLKKKYPIPMVANYFDRLSQAEHFMKIDLRSGYWLLRENLAYDGLIEEDRDLELDTLMLSSLRQLEDRDGDRSSIGHTRYDETFCGEADASDVVLGGVLKQNGYLVGFESRKLKDVERHYPVHRRSCWP